MSKMFENVSGFEPPIEQEPEFKTTLTPEQADAAQAEIRSRSFSGRNPHLGKMINCQFCGRRHREHGDIVLKKSGAVEPLQPEQKCAQVFSYIVNGYEVFREKEDGTLEPDLRTAQSPFARQTIKQILGRAAFAKKRFRPHLSKGNLKLLKLTRENAELMGFDLSEDLSKLSKEEREIFDKNLRRAQVLAKRALRKERRMKSKCIRKQQRRSRQINRGGR